MDHLDWFDIKQCSDEIRALHTAMKVGGKVMWRSSSKRPWYVDVIASIGFQVKPVAIRMSQRERASVSENINNKTKFTKEELEQLEAEGVLVHEFIDRVNMYASTWIGVKV